MILNIRAFRFYFLTRQTNKQTHMHCIKAVLIINNARKQMRNATVAQIYNNKAHEQRLYCTRDIWHNVLSLSASLFSVTLSVRLLYFLSMSFSLFLSLSCSLCLPHFFSYTHTISLSLSVSLAYSLSPSASSLMVCST